jgi:transposase
VIGALTAEGKMVMHIQDHAYNGQDIVQFLRILLRKIPGKLLVIWDGASIHRSNAVKDFLFFGGAKRLHLECLPAYAPELNPQEGVWNLLKRRELKNVCARDLVHQTAELIKAKERLRHRKAVLSQCIAHAGLRL